MWLKPLGVPECAEFFEQLKNYVVTSRYKAARTVNKELLLLYHYIGTQILQKQNQQGWGTNFKEKLLSPTSDLANQTLKDLYVFDFLNLSKEAHEREIEKGLIAHMEKFLIELGTGFSFVGRQYHLTVSGKDYYTDLLSFL